MAFAGLSRDERVALAIAVMLHVLLVAALLLQPDRHALVPIPERMTVNLTDEVGLKATAPTVTSAPRAAVAPTIASEPAPPSIPEPQPISRPAPQPAPAQAAQPRPASKPGPPRPRASEAPKAQAKPAAKSGGASRIGNDFLAGAASGGRQGDDRIPASEIGAQAKASLAQAIARQLKPHWSSPQGADAELLVTVLAFDLDPDGTLAGVPRIVRQEGITDANRPQAARHAELAVRAVQLAAPFDLPPELYNAWKRVSAFRFDRKLSQ